MKQNNRPYIIGITGGIASGKTLVSRLLKNLGAKVLNADEITHRLYETGGKGEAQIAEHFGREYIGQDGVDRKKLGQLVFSDPEALNNLNELIHPLILEEVLNQIDEDDGFVFFEAAVLVESKLVEEMDEVWLVICELDERIRRLKLRDDIGDDKIEMILKAQMTDDVKRSFADYVIDNSGTTEGTQAQVKNLFNSLMIRMKQR